VAGSPATLAQRLGIRTGRVIAPVGVFAILASAVLFLLPPHSSIAAIALGIAGVVAFGLGMAGYAGGRWWALIIALVGGLVLFVALNVAGRGVVLRVFGQSEMCPVVGREEVDTSSRYQQVGFVHTLSCPRAGTLSIRTDSTDRQETGAVVEVLDDPDGLLAPDLAVRHDLVGDALTLLAATALLVATVRFTRQPGR
jgi:hypothetical protein